MREPKNEMLGTMVPTWVAFFLLPLESKQATSGWNFTKRISEFKVNQLKVKNIHDKMGISTFNMQLSNNFTDLTWPELYLIINVKDKKKASDIVVSTISHTINTRK